ncbi:MAG: DNA polymerase III subunit gamma/tau [Acutalibacter sp.]|nr:DNA polymerase III subunit gamma/tau [Acutalibacter sp.]
MYQVLYRKYRPGSFADVVGQPQVTVTLKNELIRGRVAHAYLFTGSRGTGKTTCARILAKAVNCLSPVQGEPCGQCEVCRGLEDESILDVVEIDAASNNGVESVRSIIEETNFTPATAKYRVYIIDEVHMLSPAAFNALLKTLEEPPAHVVFILATTEVHKLLPTILSRCQRFDFHRIDAALMAQRVMDVARQEGAQVEEDAALLIAQVADGALRDALSLLDQCLGRDSRVTAEVVGAAAGLASREYLAELAGAVASQDAAGALVCVDRLHRDGKDLGRLCGELCQYFRGLMLFKTMKEPGGLVQAAAAEREEMARQARGVSLGDILHSMDCLENTLNRMRLGSQRTVLETALVRLCCPQADTSPEALLRRIEALEKGAAEPGRAVPAPPQREKGQPQHPQRPQAQEEDASETEKLLAMLDDGPAPPPKGEAPKKPEAPQKPQPKPPAPPPPPAEQKSTAEELSANAEPFPGWGEILESIQAGSSKSTAKAFEGSTAYVSGEYMLIDAPEIAFSLLKQAQQRELVRSAIRRVTGRAYKLGPYKRIEGEREKDALEGLLERAREAGVRVEESGA